MRPDVLMARSNLPRAEPFRRLNSPGFSELSAAVGTLISRADGAAMPYKR
jgi:hypothetical protein